ncbi:unnamed protein product [Rotaria magnacalcarata]|uniref:EF-hand domain-containing protein n=1 Tax=Rotaria magnacalcarata TaxID=392030 RepID=A0A8S2Q9H1_9BILA|nr:unnamed protein product [Rotaria magnacalcarata]
MNTLTVILLVTIHHLAYATNQNPGHLKPFGSVGSLFNISELYNEFPTVVEFFTNYLPKSEPIVSRQVLINDKDYSVWQTDEKLENNVYGLSTLNIEVESFKSKQRKKVQMTFGEFLDRYRKEPLLFVNPVPTILQKYLVVPKPLQCDVVIENFQSTTILPEKRGHRGPSINPDKVDLDQFPAFANIDYHIADLKSGDCLFIPNSWLFQERTLKDTISVIYNIKHHQALHLDADQLNTCSNYDPTFTLDQVVWPAEPRTFGEVIMNLINSKVQDFDKWQNAFSKHLSFDLASDSTGSALFEEFFDSVDIDSDGQITNTEVDQIKGMHQHHITDILFEITKLVHSRQTANASIPVDFNDTQSTEDDDETDKSDL